MVAQLPMVSQLLRELGLDVQAVLVPARDVLVDLGARRYNVFHVEEAAGSPHIPAQDFVERHGIASALGFGGVLYSGVLYSGGLFAVVLFTREPVGLPSAQRVRHLAPAVKVALPPHVRGPVFDGAPATA